MRYLQVKLLIINNYMKKDKHIQAFKYKGIFKNTDSQILRDTCI